MVRTWVPAGSSEVDILVQSGMHMLLGGLCIPFGEELTFSVGPNLRTLAMLVLAGSVQRWFALVGSYPSASCGAHESFGLSLGLKL